MIGGDDEGEKGGLIASKCKLRKTVEVSENRILRACRF